MTVEDFDKYAKLAMANAEYYFDKRFDPTMKKYALEKKRFFLGMQRKNLDRKKHNVPCLAGRSIAVLEPNGAVRPCELLDIFGNVRNFDYDLPKLLRSPDAMKVKEWIRDTTCECTHCVFADNALSHNFTASMIQIPIQMMAHKEEKNETFGNNPNLQS